MSHLSFSDRLIQSVSKTSPVVLGVDPNFSKMPTCLQPTSPKDITSSLSLFSKTVMDASVGQVCGVKFQSAYFEQWGLAGYAALAEAMRPRAF